MNMTHNHFMIDLETTGTDPAHCAIIQIAGVAFNFEERDVSVKMFDQCLLVPPSRYWEEDTRDFWAKHPEVLRQIWGRMRDARTVLTEFNAWVAEQSDGKEPILWAKPSHFEQPFLQNYYRHYEIASPFHYRMTEDLNSWCRARGRPTLSLEVDVQGDAHNALHDTLHQVDVLFKLMESTEVTINA